MGSIGMGACGCKLAVVLADGRRRWSSVASPWPRGSQGAPENEGEGEGEGTGSGGGSVVLPEADAESWPCCGEARVRRRDEMDDAGEYRSVEPVLTEPPCLVTRQLPSRWWWYVWPGFGLCSSVSSLAMVDSESWGEGAWAAGVAWADDACRGDLPDGVRMLSYLFVCVCVRVVIGERECRVNKKSTCKL